MATKSNARHRAACRPKTPIYDIAKNVTSPTSRRAAIAATGTGLVLTAFASGAANANPAGPEATVNVAELAAKASTQVASNPVVTVDAGNGWDKSTASVTTENAPAPRRPAPAPSFKPYTGPVPSAPDGSVLKIAYKYLGVPYVWGGTTPAGFDCSGFVQYVFRQYGINLPRNSEAQAAAGVRISASEARPGDLVHWHGHIAIYIGGGKIIHAPKPGDHVKIAPLYGHYTFVRIG